MLSKFKKVEDRPIGEILSYLHLSPNRLMQNMNTWISQGYVSPKHPVYKALKARRLQNRQEQQKKKHDQMLKTYQALRDRGFSKQKTAENMGVSLSELQNALSHWTADCIRAGKSDEEICQLLRYSEIVLKSLKNKIEANEHQKQLLREERLQQNRQYSQRHLKSISEAVQSGRNDYLIFDIEAVQCPDEPIEIAVIDLWGNTVMNQLIKPVHIINKRIERLTGISNEMVAQKPNIRTVMPIFKSLTDGKTLLSWGSDYDTVVLKKACANTGVQLNCRFECAQHIHMGQIDAIDQIALGTAANIPNQNHRALDDCQLVLKILKADLKKFEQ